MLIRDANLRFTTPPKPRARTNRVVVHHTAGPPRQSVQGIHAFHRDVRKWIGVGYNLVQDHNGEWWSGRGVDRIGAHAANHNSTTVGICLTGNFEVSAVPEDRWRSLVDMCAHLCRTYDLTPDRIVGHRELAATKCPGKHLSMMKLRAAVSLAGAIEADPPVYRVIVDGRQVSANAVMPNLLTHVSAAIEDGRAQITLERV